MIKDVLESIAHIEIYGIMALVAFVVLFAVVLLRALRLDSATVQTLSRMPLDNAPSAEKGERADD
jgi:hypothetical protein